MSDPDELDILALDLAKRTGWARGRLDSEAPTFGSISFGKDGASNYARFAHALRWAVDIFKNDPPDVLVIEAPISVQAFSMQQGAKILFGLPAVITGVAYECGVFTIHEYDVRDIRGMFTGHRSLKTDIAKAATVRRCKQLGWNVEDHNAADACALWMYQCARVHPGPTLRRLASVGICV
jgi:hypothetical protein